MGQLGDRRCGPTAPCQRVAWARRSFDVVHQAVGELRAAGAGPEHPLVLCLGVAQGVRRGEQAGEAADVHSPVARPRE